jgi:cell division protein FtsB
LALSGKISSTDKLKLDEYLASVREVERSIERMRTDKDKAEERARDAGARCLR